MGRKPKPGRRTGSRNRGYFFRKNRGWYVRVPGEPKLCDLEGNHLKSPDSAEEAAAAYARYLTQAQQITGPKGNNEKDSIVMAEACQRYLQYVERHNSAGTLTKRQGFLFDFCTGLPARWREKREEAPEKERLHKGYGDKRVVDITPEDIDDWVAAHKGWKSNRAPIQAVRRAMTYCVKELKLLAANPIRGVHVDQVGHRATYFTPEVEEAIYKSAPADLAQVVRFGILAGTRPGCEYARVEKRHVEIDEQGNMLWHFPAKEAKVKSKDRFIHIPKSLKPIAEAAVEKYPTGKLFRNKRGRPWDYGEMKRRFRRLRTKLMAQGVPIQKDDVIYSARHTFAKRQLGGYWTGQPVSIEILAGLMGNTPEVCWKHYGQWCSRYMEPLRKAVDY